MKRKRSNLLYRQKRIVYCKKGKDSERIVYGILRKEGRARE
jgi:hypothetical protein